MGNNSIDDDWGDLLDDEAPAPAVPKSVKARKTESVVAVGRSTPLATPKARIEVPAPKRRSTRGKEAGAPTRGPAIDATRRLVVPPPPVVGQPEPDDRFPTVPTWGGANDKDRMSIDPVTVPQPSDGIDVGDLGARDLSANIRLDALHPNLPAEAPVEDSSEDSLTAIRRERMPLTDSQRLREETGNAGVVPGSPESVIEPTDDLLVPPPFQSAVNLAGVAKKSRPPPIAATKTAVPQPIEETTSAPGLDEIARSTVKTRESESESESLPSFGALNAVVAKPDGDADALRAPATAAAEQPSSLMPWVLASVAVIAVGAIALAAMGPGEEPDKPAVAAASAQAPSRPAKPSPTPKAAPTAVAASAGVADNATPQGAATNSVPAVATASANDAGDDADGADGTDGAEGADGAEESGGSADARPVAVVQADPPAVEPAEAPATPSTTPTADPKAASRYDEGAARYARDQSQEALEIMATAACVMDDGVKARSAFRKLTGGDVRKRVMIACRRRGAIDLNAKGDEPTPAELLRAAERALDSGDHQTALALAKKSNRIERSQAAVYVTALAACAAGDKEKAASMRRHLNRARKAELEKRCPDMPEAE